MSNIAFTSSGKVITIIHDGESHAINPDHLNYAKIKTIITEHLSKGVSLEPVLKLISLVEAVEPALKKAGKGILKIVNGMVRIDGHPIDHLLNKKILEFLKAKKSITALVKFWTNLAQNPDPIARRDLYGFLSKLGHPITQDGHFIAYKSITTDFKDHHTRKFDYRIGMKPTMKREDCNPNPRETCSRGLHVANYNYAWGFGKSNIIDCKINPRDVVAIPVDYNNEKMRVCAFEVVAVNSGGEIKASHISTRALNASSEVAPAKGQKRVTFYKLEGNKILTTRRVKCPRGWRTTRPELPGKKTKKTKKTKTIAEIKVKPVTRMRTYYKKVGRRVHTKRAQRCPPGFQSRKPK